MAYGQINYAGPSPVGGNPGNSFGLLMARLFGQQGGQQAPMSPEAAQAMAQLFGMRGAPQQYPGGRSWGGWTPGGDMGGGMSNQWQGWTPNAGMGLGNGMANPGGFGAGFGGTVAAQPAPVMATPMQPPAPAPSPQPMRNQPMPPRTRPQQPVSNRMTELNVPYDEAGSTGSRLFDRYQARLAAERAAATQQQGMRRPMMNRN